MNRYSPLWSQIVDSSLWCEPDFVVKVFLTMIAKKDMDDIVRGNAFNISQWSKKTEAEVLEAIKVLSSPDTRRVEKQEFDGRRIEKVPEGYKVLMGAHYRKMMSTAGRREYNRIWAAEKRKKTKKPTPLPGEDEFTRAIREGASPERQDEIVSTHLPTGGVE